MKLILAVLLCSMTAAGQHAEVYGWPQDHPTRNKIRFVAKDGKEIGNCDLSRQDGRTVSNCVIDPAHITDVINIYVDGMKSQEDWDSQNYKQLENAAKKVMQLREGGK